jgi:hypothetical protein
MAFNFKPKPLYKNKRPEDAQISHIAGGHRLSDVSNRVSSRYLKRYSRDVAGGASIGSSAKIHKMDVALDKSEVRHGGENERYATATMLHTYNAELNRSHDAKSAFIHHRTGVHVPHDSATPHSASPHSASPPVAPASPHSASPPVAPASPHSATPPIASASPHVQTPNKFIPNTVNKFKNKLKSFSPFYNKNK